MRRATGATADSVSANPCPEAYGEFDLRSFRAPATSLGIRERSNPTIREPMRVLGIVPYPYDTAPGQRFRIEQWQGLLEREHGIELTFAAFLDAESYRVFPKAGNTSRKIASTLRGLGRRICEVTTARHWDAAYIYLGAAVVGPALLERMLARRIPFVFDFDDAIFIPHVSEANRAFAFLKSHTKTGTICRLAAHVIPGNEYLAEYARRHNANVTTIPTTVDTEKYTPRHKATDQLPVIGWSGSTTTAKYIEETREILVELAKSHRFRLRIIGAPGYDPIPGIETEVLPWVSATEVQDLSAIDIGLMPLRDDQWARGKCGLKALQYMALAIPAVCSPVGVSTKIISHGLNGFLASTPDEWLACLRKILDTPELRRWIGAAARRTVEANYSAHSQVPRLADVFRSVQKEFLGSPHSFASRHWAE